MLKTIAAALLALPLTVHAGDGMTQVKQQLQVNAAGAKVVVRLTLENGGAKSVFVPKAVYQDDQIFRREFIVTDAATGAEVDYIGPMVKRGPFTRDDFLAVKPGHKRSHSIDITRSYDFKPKHSYRLSYEGGYVGDLGKVDAATAVAVPAVTFTFN
jgi:hypothetical protein